MLYKVTALFSASLLIGLAGAQSLECPIMSHPADEESAPFYFAGSEFRLCCSSCEPKFKADPQAALNGAAKEGRTVGLFLFDPVSKNRIDKAKAVGHIDHAGLRYCFESQANMSLFKASPDRYATRPSKESLVCPVGKKAVRDHAEASGYADHEGVRCYFCCAGCEEPFIESPAKFIGNARVQTTAVLSHAPPKPEFEPTTKVASGKYIATLQTPDEGFFAGEEIAMEIRLVDTTQEDLYEGGHKGVPNAKARAVISMPEMPGMPEATPTVRRTGVPGDYALEAFFPHGGVYQIKLDIEPSGESPFTVNFMVMVNDETGRSTNRPYALDVASTGRPRAGQPFNLVLIVRETKSGQPETHFQVVHEEKFHLLIASEDFQWFLHEHPTMNDKGEWSIPIEFPAGGKYWIYSDVAPVGKGSQILIASIETDGPKPTWLVNWEPNLGPSIAHGISGRFNLPEAGSPVGKMATFTIKLTEADTGRPISDLQKWLGAWGHLMIFSQDGQTVVHSHPEESEAMDRLVKQGEIRFNGRIPKPGLYRAFAQFKRNGQIVTLPFTLSL